MIEIKTREEILEWLQDYWANNCSGDIVFNEAFALLCDFHAASQLNKWFSVADGELPEKHHSSGVLELSLPVLVYNHENFGAHAFYPEERMRVTLYNHKSGLWWDERGGNHWCYLPTPPSLDKTN